MNQSAKPENGGCCASGAANAERKPETWQARYEAGETGWDRGESSPALLAWLNDGELKPNRILVPGCGNGHEVVELASRGFDVTAVDFASTPIENLRTQLADKALKAELVQQDIFEFDPPLPFEAIYEQTCLCAIDPQQREAYEQVLANCLQPDGRLFALFMQSGKMDTGPPFPCDIEDMKQLFDSPRWQWPAEQIDVTHPAGLTEIAVVLRRIQP